MWLRVGVGVGRLDDFAGGRIDVEVALRRAGDAIGLVETGVEPLRGVGRRHLVDEHVCELIVEGLGVVAAGEVAVGFAPAAPATGQTVDHLLGAALRAENWLAIFIEKGIARRRRTAARPPCGSIWRP